MYRNKLEGQAQMHTNGLNLKENLRYLCSLETSIAETSRKTGINRQQLNKYLNGTTSPSINTLQRICQHFSVDETELFLPAPEFKKLFKLRDTTASFSTDLLQTLSIIQKNSASEEIHAKGFLGKYASYGRFDAEPDKLQRSVAYMFKKDDVLSTIRIEYDADRNADFKSHASSRRHGFVYSLDQKVYNIETHKLRETDLTILSPVTSGRRIRLQGKSVRLSQSYQRNVVTGDVLWEKIDNEPIKVADLRVCGYLGMDDPTLDKHVLSFFQH
jgi:transcriptional regulator with XRE-family HTH domain